MKRLVVVVGNGRRDNAIGSYGGGEEESGTWLTRRVIAACLWSALIGLICGYGWLFAHVSRVHP